MPGRELDGILQAMDYLPPANRAALGPSYDVPVSAEGKHVVIIGGGDTGADCLGHRAPPGRRVGDPARDHAAAADARPEINPVADLAADLRTSSAHEEGGERVFAVSTERFVGDDGGQVDALELVEVEMNDGRFEPVAGHRAGDPRPAGAAGDGVPRPAAARVCSSSSASRSTRAATSLATRRS